MSLLRGCLLGTAIVLTVGASAALAAQAQIYRCVNRYTDALPTHGAQACHALAVPEAGAAVPALAMPATTTGKADASEHASPSHPPVPTSTHEMAVMQQALTQAQSRWQELEAQWNNGHPVRTALELRNPQVWMQRQQSLQSERAAVAAEVQRLQEEIERRKRAQ